MAPTSSAVRQVKTRVVLMYRVRCFSISKSLAAFLSPSSACSSKSLSLMCSMAAQKPWQTAVRITSASSAKICMPE